MLAACCLLFLSALFVRARRTHFTVSFAGYTLASGFQKLAGGVGFYMTTDPATLGLWFLVALWFWIPINATILHAVVAYAWPGGRPNRYVVIAIYATHAAYAVAAFFDPVLVLAAFMPSWYSFCVLSVVLFAIAPRRIRTARSTVERTEAKYLAIYLAIGTPFTIEALYILLALGRAALWEIAVGYALATIVMLYGILRHEIFAIDLYAKRATYYTVVSIIVALSFVLLEQFVQDVFTLQSGSGILAAIGAALLIAPVAYLARRPVDALFPDLRPSEDYLQRRRLEVYRAQLEVALADGILTANENNVLNRARSALGITEAQHRRFRDEILQGMRRTRVLPAPN